MSTVPSAVIESIRNLSSVFGRGEASTGTRFFPSNGLHDCIVLKIDVSAGTTKSNQVEVPCSVFEFEYQLLSDPESPKEPRSFKGKAFYLPHDSAQYSAPGAMKRTRFDIERDRFLGHIQVILGREVDKNQVDSELQLVFTKVQASKVVVKVHTETKDYVIKQGERAGQTGKDRQEYLTQLLSN